MVISIGFFYGGITDITIKHGDITDITIKNSGKFEKPR